MCVLQSIYSWPWPTIWAAVQALGVPAALYAAIWLPRRWLAHGRLEDLVAYRNLAWYLVRWMPQVKCAAGAEWDEKGYEASVFDACLMIVKGIPLDKVHPPAMTERFGRIQVHGSIAKRLIEQRPPDWMRFREESAVCRVALERIDDHLRYMGCSFDHEQIAHPPRRSSLSPFY